MLPVCKQLQYVHYQVVNKNTRQPAFTVHHKIKQFILLET